MIHITRLKKIASVLFILISVLPVYAKIQSSSWADLSIEDAPNSIALYKLADWEILTSGGKAKVNLPLYTNSYDSISLLNEFDVPQDTLNKFYIFKSNGLHGVVKIFINNTLVYESPNGSAPFRFRISSDIIKAGKKNSLQILLMKSEDLVNSFPSFTYLFSEPEYLGILRPFYLVPANQHLIEAFRYSLEETNTNVDISYNYSLNKLLINSLEKQDGLSFQETIRDSNGKMLIQRAINYLDSQEKIKGTLNLPAEKLWSPSNPVSYNLSVTVKRFGQPLITRSITVAFRNMQSKDNTIFLNGVASQIRGVTYYENIQSAKSQPVLGQVTNYLRAIKDDGFNAVRFISHIPDESFLSAADSIGLLVYIDMPVKRYPKDAFKQDNFLENLKNTISKTLQAFATHPSFVAMGMGNEVLLSDPATQKFFLILNGTIIRDFPFLTYLSVAPEADISIKEVADIYILDMYESINKRKSIISQSNIPFSLAGTATLNSSYNYLNEDDVNFSINRKKHISRDINAIFKDLSLQGGFFESFMDWYGKSVTHQNLSNPNFIIKNGIYDSTFTKYEWAKDISDPIWDYAYLGELNVTQKDKSTNVFSIVMFFFSLLFLFFYKRYPRLSENYRRSLKHPYGFYVDLRERRIIPVFNSFVTGAHNALILTIFIGSYIYYYNNSFYIQEILRTIFPVSIYCYVVEISQSVWLIIPTIFILIAAYPIYIGIVVKIYSLLSRKSIRTRQSLAIGLWSGSPIIFLLPFSIAAYHFILGEEYNQVLLIIFALFMVWIQFRLINGIRVLLLSKFQSIFILLFLSYSIPIVMFLILFDHQPMWTDYLITLLNSHTFF